MHKEESIEIKAEQMLPSRCRCRKQTTKGREWNVNGGKGMHEFARALYTAASGAFVNASALDGAGRGALTELSGFLKILRNS